MDVDFITTKALRREPPMPLGDTVDYFSVSAATPPGATHPSNTSLRLKLDNPHPDSPFRSSQLVNGRVHIQSPQSVQTHLSLRVYFESRTLYWSLELQSPENKFDQTMSVIKSPSALDYANVMRHEVHRGVVPASHVTLSWDDRVEVQPDQERVLPFSFIVPKRMSVTEWNENPYAPRDLCPVERSPPATLRDSRYGSVQWVVEVTMDLVPNPTSKQDPDTLLRQSTDDQVVTRIAFPFVPSLEDVSPLRDEPFFGQDASKDSFGSKRLSEEELESGKKAVMERVRARGGKWEVHVKGFPAGKSTMWSELHVPAGALVSTDASTFPIILFLKHTGAQSSLKSLFQFPIILFLKHTGAQSSLKSLFRAAKPKPVHVRHEIERFVGRFPAPVVPASERDGNQLPTFEDAVGGDAPPTFDESVGAS
ncbi:unnamed protein product [Rhizoctonia solani]|uniref:Uncharacterized protein n=1 Tax=Rhizoctonia solani TaxID=456999 RepID=A0A8H3CZA2_9AGAM|nr:unnamed protein product [Rhizoctonia solani]